MRSYVMSGCFCPGLVWSRGSADRLFQGKYKALPGGPHTCLDDLPKTAGMVGWQRHTCFVNTIFLTTAANSKSILCNCKDWKAPQIWSSLGFRVLRDHRVIWILWETFVLFEMHWDWMSHYYYYYISEGLNIYVSVWLYWSTCVHFRRHQLMIKCERFILWGPRMHKMTIAVLQVDVKIFSIRWDFEQLRVRIDSVSITD